MPFEFGYACTTTVEDRAACAAAREAAEEATSKAEAEAAWEKALDNACIDLVENSGKWFGW